VTAAQFAPGRPRLLSRGGPGPFWLSHARFFPGWNQCDGPGSDVRSGGCPGYGGAELPQVGGVVQDAADGCPGGVSLPASQAGAYGLAVGSECGREVAAGDAEDFRAHGSGDDGA
jgi:hypothetical protein